MNKQPHRGLSILGSQVTSTVTVALVLLMLGIVALLSVAARNAVESMESGISLTVVLAEGATPEQAEGLGNALRKAPYAQTVEFADADEVLRRWNAAMPGDEPPADINPFLPEWEVTLNPAWSSPDSIAAITTGLRGTGLVEEISSPYEAAAEVYDTVRTLRLILLSVAIALLVISFVLIANTVRLSIHSRRFTINTMTLVGATDAYIRRPFIAGAVYGGIIAAAAACLVLLPALWYMTERWPVTATVISWSEAAIVFGGMFVAGAALCALAAAMATSKYLKNDYDSIVN